MSHGWQEDLRVFVCVFNYSVGGCFFFKLGSILVLRVTISRFLSVSELFDIGENYSLYVTAFES